MEKDKNTEFFVIRYPPSVIPGLFFISQTSVGIGKIAVV